jgi:biopolymer transport protein ExbB/TolQ
MIGWVVLGVLVFAVLVLALAVLVVLGRLRRFGDEAHRLQRRTVDAQALQPAVEALQQRAEALQATLERLADRAEALQAPEGNNR